MIDRRSVMRVMGAGGVVAAVGVGSRPLMAAGRLTVILLDRDLGRFDRRAADAAIGAASPIMLERDLVRHWRRDLRDGFISGGKGIALVRWDKAVLLKGLAREEGLAVRETRIGRSIFRIEIG